MTDEDNLAKSAKMWESQYGECGAEHIQNIYESIYKLKPLIEEVGWQCLDIDNGDVRILIEFEKPE